MEAAQHTKWIRQVFQDVREDHKIKRSQARCEIGGDVKFNRDETSRDASRDIRCVRIDSYTLPTTYR